MLRIHESNSRPDQNGDLMFEAQAYDLLPGDKVLDGQYAVLTATRGKHDGEDAVNLTLKLAETYDYEMQEFGEVDQSSDGRISLKAHSWCIIRREVKKVYEAPMDPESHGDLINDEGEWDEYTVQQEVATRELRSGWIIQYGPNALIRKIDTVYDNGLIVFSDGTAYQSKPELRWTAWSV